MTKIFGRWMGRAQGRLGGVLGGVQVAELEGHVTRFAVYLIHKRFGPAPADEYRVNPPGVYR
jgi:hypothetical protein